MTSETRFRINVIFVSLPSHGLLRACVCGVKLCDAVVWGGYPEPRNHV
jgi:hypothetical protein